MILVHGSCNYFLFSLPAEVYYFLCIVPFKQDLLVYQSCSFSLNSIVLLLFHDI